MSYDVSFYEFVGESLNYTYNCSPMFRMALGGGGINDLNGQQCREMIPTLKAALAHMTAPENKDTYKALNPANGWGDHATATKFLANILATCEAHPNAVIKIS